METNYPDNVEQEPASFDTCSAAVAPGSFEEIDLKNKAASDSVSSETFAMEESASHGDIFLPVSTYHCLIPLSYTQLAPHWHEEMEITLIREGCSIYRIYADHFQANEGDILVVPPRCIHSASEISGRTMISDSLVFHLDLLGASGQDLSASRYLRPLAAGNLDWTAVIHAGAPGYEEIRAAFVRTLTCFQEKQDFYPLSLREYLLHLLILLFENGYLRKPVGSPDVSNREQVNRQQLGNLLNYINFHYREKLSVSRLADHIGFSESHFMFYFKKNVGMTCTEYINHYRIQQAAKALEETNQPVLEIALDNGFDNVSYFNRQFKRQFGMTPKEFRTK